MSHLDADTLAAYVDGRLASGELGEVDRHIDACGSCRKELSVLAAADEPRLGRYHVLRELGAGAMGIVLRAYDPELARPVALKLVRDADAEALRAEARALAKLRHPNVVTVYDVLVEDDKVYVAMELVEGDTLRGYCKTRTAREILAACVAAGRGLAAAHDAGVIHRDVKPENVLVSEDGEARVSDFGPAIAGTPAYMAPEVARGEAPTAASDQYSFCVTTYEMLTGKRPHDGPPAMPAWIWNVLERGLAADPAERHASMAAVVDALAIDPRVKRRRRAVLAGGAAVAIATGALAVHVAQPGAPSCAIDDSALADAWDINSKARVTRALAAAAGDDIAGKAVAAIDDYARVWLDARRDACAATRVRGEQSEATLASRDACLDRGRRELGELVRVLAAADAKTAGAAQEAVSRLRDPIACGGADAPRFALARTDGDNATLDRATALEYLGKLDEASQLVAPLTTPDSDVLAEALLVRARIESDRAQHEQAESSLFTALAAAERAHDDALVAAIWVEIVMTTGAQEHRFDLALSNARAADAALARIEPGAELLARYDFSLGGLLLAHGDVAAARKRLEAAVAASGDDPRRRAQAGSAHMSLCDAHRQQGDFAGAREHCKQGLALLEASLGHDHPRVAIALNTFAVLEFSAHDLAAAEALYHRAIDIFERRGARDHTVYALALSNLGALYSERDDLDQARTYFERARAMFDQYHPTHPHHLMPLQGLASLALRTGDAARALEYYQQVRTATAAVYAPDSPQLGTVDYDLALSYRLAKQPQRARAALEDLVPRMLGKQQWMIAARALDTEASLSDDVKDYATGIQLRERALDVVAHVDDPATRAMIQRQVGNAYRELKKPDLALPPLEEALAYFDQHAEDSYDLGMARLSVAMALSESGRDRPRSLALARLAADDLAKAHTGENLEHFRAVVARFLAAH